MSKSEEKSIWASETDESLELTLKVLMRKYPKPTPVMKEIYDELQKRKGEKVE